MLEKVHFIPFAYSPSNPQGTVSPTPFNILLSSGGIEIYGQVPNGFVVFCEKNFPSKTGRLMEESPGKIGMHGPISKLNFMETKASLLFGSGEDIPTKKVQFSLFNAASPNKVSLNFIEGFSDFV